MIEGLKIELETDLLLEEERLKREGPKVVKRGRGRPRKSDRPKEEKELKK